MTPDFTEIVNDLAQHGYSVSDGVIPNAEVAELADVARTRKAEGQLSQARTGKTKTENDSLRGDSIGWLSEQAPEQPVADCLAGFEALRLVLNEQLFLNVHEIESHFAIYPPEAVYQKHLDQFATGEQARRLSLVLYLNADWLDEDGGALRLHLDESTSASLDITPIGGRLVLFDSSRFWHEVLPSRRERVSIAGWFRTRTIL